MDTITNDIMQQAAEQVILLAQDGVDIHTVTITLDGASGGALLNLAYSRDDDSVNGYAFAEKEMVLR